MKRNIGQADLILMMYGKIMEIKTEYNSQNFNRDFKGKRSIKNAFYGPRGLFF